MLRAGAHALEERDRIYRFQGIEDLGAMVRQRFAFCGAVISLTDGLSGKLHVSREHDIRLPNRLRASILIDIEHFAPNTEMREPVRDMGPCL